MTIENKTRTPARRRRRPAASSHGLPVVGACCVAVAVLVFAGYGCSGGTPKRRVKKKPAKPSTSSTKATGGGTKMTTTKPVETSGPKKPVAGVVDVPATKLALSLEGAQLVDSIDCGDPNDPHQFKEAPAGASEVQQILGRDCRVIPRRGEARYFAYLVGEGKGLVAKAAYCLTVEYPDDRPRNIFILNRGAEVARGVHTGAALGDVLYTYTNNNSESLRIPQSQKYLTWKCFFNMHENLLEGVGLPRGKKPPLKRTRRPADGFWVVISQGAAKQDPINEGAAVAKINLYRIPDQKEHYAKLNMPPEKLPRRFVFWREEMSDGILAKDNSSHANDADWFEDKARLMKLLAFNTYGKDLLEFGHNQGWDANIHGGNQWYWASSTPGRWKQILDIIEKYDLYAMPYYEWSGGAGAKGLGKEKRARPLGDIKTYTHITWSEIMNIDITDPDSLVDAKKVLDATVVRYKDKVKFAGAWFRPRPSMLPISFSDRCLGLFSKDTNRPSAVTREQLKSDGGLLSTYYDWWFGKRREFLLALRDYLKEKAGDELMFLFTPDSSEPGPSLKGGKQIVTDDGATWRRLIATPEHSKLKVTGYDTVVSQNRHLEAVLSPPGTWGKWEWNHSIPQPDPERYRDDDGFLFTYAFNRAYTVSSKSAFDDFRTKAGLAVVRHFSLNENTMHKDLGYFVCDMERPGPYALLAEVRAVAYGDPRYLGYLAGASYNTGSPEYSRAFNMAFLSLPALPSAIVENACVDREIVVRTIGTDEYGTYVAVANTGYGAKDGLTVNAGVSGRLFDSATGVELGLTDGRIKLSMYPCELKTFRVAPAE